MTDCTEKNGPLQKNANTCQIPQFATRECHGTQRHEFPISPSLTPRPMDGGPPPSSTPRPMDGGPPPSLSWHPAP